jgi:hypothetical protein
MVDVSPSDGQVADFKIEDGCFLCGGELAVRVTPDGATTVCRTCQWFARPHVKVGADGVTVSYSPAGQA